MFSNKSSVCALGLATLLSLAGVGCGIQSGTTVMTQKTHSDPVMGTVPSSGEYALFTAVGLNAIATVKVNQGDPMGFRHADDGHWVAVAGNNQPIDLPRGTEEAYWKLQK